MSTKINVINNRAEKAAEHERKRGEKHRLKKDKVEKILEKRKNEAELSVSDLKTLCAYKKRKGDPSIASAGKDRAKLLCWWKEYKARPSPTVSPAGSPPPSPSGSDDEVEEVVLYATL